MSNKKIAIPPSSMEFLIKLKNNNNRDWFNINKTEFIEKQNFIEIFADAVLVELNISDIIETPSGKKSLNRIYRDTRFAKNKIPYKNNWSGSFKRATRQRRGGYYFHIEPNNSFVAGGFQAPNPEDLKRIRDDISFDPSTLNRIINNKLFIANFGNLQGDQLKSAPRGYDINDEAIKLLRYKQFLLIKKFTDQEVLSLSFVKQVTNAFKLMRPFLDYMSEILTVDSNGLIL